MGKKFLVQIEYDFFTERFPEFKGMSDVEKVDFVKKTLDGLADHLRRDNSIVFFLSSKVKVYELPEDSDVAGIYFSGTEAENLIARSSQLEAKNS
ncbi:hypothetical protein [Draconibacterium sp.]|uniref:hypothetical protein n=1 Tax=Draconibacterium sp. TaxID=1965318 RepID=UPI003562C12A